MGETWSLECHPHSSGKPASEVEGSTYSSPDQDGHSHLQFGDMRPVVRATEVVENSVIADALDAAAELRTEKQMGNYQHRHLFHAHT